MKYLTRTTNLHATIALARETNTKIIIDFRSQVYTFRYITFGVFLRVPLILQKQAPFRLHIQKCISVS